MKRYEIPKYAYDVLTDGGKRTAIYVGKMKYTNIEKCKKLLNKLIELEKARLEVIPLLYKFPEAIKIRSSYDGIWVSYDKTDNILNIYLPKYMDLPPEALEGLPIIEDKDGGMMLDVDKVDLALWGTLMSRLIAEMSKWISYLEEEVEP